mgnify:CR=1 FL=1
MMTMASMPRIERLNYLFGGVLIIVCALTTHRAQALGAAVGVALTAIAGFAPGVAAAFAVLVILTALLTSGAATITRIASNVFA